MGNQAPNNSRLPSLSGDYASDLPTLQAFMSRMLSDLTSVMQGNLTAEANLGWDFHTLQVTAPGTFPIPVPTDLGSVSAVIVAQAQDTVSTVPVSVAGVTVGWSYNGSTLVNITALSGLTSGHPYNVKLVFIP